MFRFKGVSRSLSVCTVVLLFATEGAVAQSETGPDPVRPALERRHLSGPRFGFTVFTGDVADRRDLAELEPLMTQFGWQFETQIVSTTSGVQALMEWVPLVGGVEQGELNLSLAWLAGLRSAGGLEVGVGPNVSYNRDSDDITTSMQVAGGASIPVGDFAVPVNMSVGIAEGGPRFTALVGWIVGG